MLRRESFNDTVANQDQRRRRSSGGSHGGHGCGRERGRGRGSGEDIRGNNDNEKPQDRTRIKCYNCNKYCHYSSQCKNKKKEEKANLAETKAKETALLMAVTELPMTFLLHRNSEILEPKGMWYLDTGVTNHMTGDKLFFHDLIEKPGGFFFTSKISPQLRSKVLDQSSYSGKMKRL